MWKECWLDLWHHLMHWPHMQTQTCGKSTSFYQFHHQHHLMALDDAPMKSLLPGHTCQTLFSWFRVFRVQNKSYQLR
jgi:hypothetical protein